MDTIPFLLQLIQNHTLLYPIILSGNLNLAATLDSNQVDFPSKYAVHFPNLVMDENYVFDIIIMKDQLEVDKISLSICGIPPHYFEQSTYYFGEITLFESVMPTLKALNFNPELESHPYLVKLKYKYKFEHFIPPALISIRPGSDCVSIQFGSYILDYMDMDKKIQKFRDQQK